MPCPLSDRHDIVVSDVGGWLWSHYLRTPGVRGGHEASSILDDPSEVHADGFLRIRPERGGQTRAEGISIGGCPELIVEISASSRGRDLGPKLASYERAGAHEYVVLALDPDEVFWHVRPGDKLSRVEPGADGIFRSRTSSGLWLDPTPPFAEDAPGLIATLDLGLASEEHAGFVARLAAHH